MKTIITILFLSLFIRFLQLNVPNINDVQEIR